MDDAAGRFCRGTSPGGGVPAARRARAGRRAPAPAGGAGGAAELGRRSPVASLGGVRGSQPALGPAREALRAAERAQRSLSRGLLVLLAVGGLERDDPA